MAALADAPSRPVVHRLPALLRRFVRDESGATALEYGLICALLMVTVSVTIRMIANSYYTKVLTPLTSSMSGQ